MTTLPALEDLLSAEEITATKEEVQKITADAYQPVLDGLLQRFPLDVGGKAKVTAEVKLALVEEAGKPVITNDVSIGLAFIPEKTYDMFEEANRIIIREMFAHLFNKK